jgi:hypothetical protein
VKGKQMQCEGYRRTGGAFTIGPVKWEQCPEDAVVILTVEQEGKTQDFPACLKCWKETLENDQISIAKYELTIGGDNAEQEEESN